MLRPEGTHYAPVITKPEVKRATATEGRGSVCVTCCNLWYMSKMLRVTNLTPTLTLTPKGHRVVILKGDLN